MRPPVPPLQPRRPFLVMNQYHVTKFEAPLKFIEQLRWGWTESIQGLAFDIGRFKQDAHIIDIDGRKFPVTGAIKKGWNLHLANLTYNPFVPPAKRFYKFDYIVGEPQQLTFDQAREEIIELICSRGWFSKTQDRESQKSFRTRMAKCDNMQDLIVGRRDPDPKGTYIGGIHGYGEYVF